MEYLPKPKNSVKFSCNRCEKGFTTAGNLKRHIMNIHMDRDGGAEGGLKETKCCRYCKKSYSRADYLAQHIKSMHENSSRYNCEHCDKCFTQKGSLNRHVSSVHMNVKEFCCKHCEYRAMSYNDLKKHAAKAHFNRSRYECSMCGHSSWSASTIKQHIQSYHSEKMKRVAKKCKFCGIVINCEKESYPIHVAECKAMLGLSDGQSMKGKKNKKRSKNKSSSLNVDALDELDKEIETEDIPWEALCNLKDEPSSDNEVHAVPENCNTIEGASACAGPSPDGIQMEVPMSSICMESVIEGYIKDIQDDTIS